MAKPRSSIVPSAAEIPVFQAYLSALPQGIAVTDMQGHVVYANPAAEQLLGVSASHMQGKPLPSKILRDLVGDAISNQASVKQYGAEFSNPYSQPVFVDIDVTPLLNGAQQDGVILTLEPQGVMSQLQQQTMRKEAIRSAGMMAAMLAHEVKNPLAGIKGAAQLLEQQVDAGQRKLATLITNEVDRIKGLVNQIEFLSSPLVGDAVPVNIHEVLQYVKELAENGFAKHVTFVERYDPSLPQVAGHRELLIQLVLNLVKNAAEAMVDMQDATITLTTRYDSTYRLAVQGSNKMVFLPIRVSVQDNGPGIPEEQQATIFDPFVTTKPDGKGLGLTIVSKIVADHGGNIELDKKVKQGTGFTLMLPVYR